ncbi:MAG: hypothetical protein ACE5R6_09975 [Candidatus Heimdallarchaeota archaeon]
MAQLPSRPPFQIRSSQTARAHPDQAPWPLELSRFSHSAGPSRLGPPPNPPGPARIPALQLPRQAAGRRAPLRGVFGSSG